MNQNPEQIARDEIDKQLIASGWVIQNKTQINLAANVGVAVREYQTNVGPADYVLFVNQIPVGVIEAKRSELGQSLSMVEEQGEDYANAKLKYLNNDPLPFVYISTGDITKFTNYKDPKPRAREVFTFHRPETLATWIKNEKTLRAGLLDIPQLPTDGLRDCQIDTITELEKSFRALATERRLKSVRSIRWPPFPIFFTNFFASSNASHFRTPNQMFNPCSLPDSEIFSRFCMSRSFVTFIFALGHLGE